LLKDLGILAAGARWFKRQCDCFVTKRRSLLVATRKNSRNLCKRGQSERLVAGGRQARCNWRCRTTAKSRVRANVMGHKTP